MIRHALGLFALSLLACNGCRHEDAVPTSAAASTTPVTSEAVVTDGDDGKSFDVARGTTIVFRLRSNGGTGYVWVAVALGGSAIAQQGDRTTEAVSMDPGAPRNDVYRFVAVAPGVASVEMAYERPWEKAQPPARTVRVTINVR